MKRILLTLAFCSPLLFSTTSVQSIELIGPNGETQLSTEQYGPILASETLWAISTKLKPDNSVSVYQTLVAIYKLNPTAFNKGNVNGIIPNSVINIPSADFIAQQTNKEAYELLKPTQKAKVEKPVVKDVAPVVIEEVKPAAPEIDPEIISNLQKEVSDRDSALATSDQLISEQEKELLLLNEQLLVLTEKNQVLKLKLQPLSDQISMLGEQVEEEISVQKELQALIEQYKAQIDSFVEPPFSGDGLINEIFRIITSSVTSVLIAILLPLLLLSAIIVLMSRLKSKRELAIQEQEMAESTAILMEQQSGKFDSLLTDDLEGDDGNDESIDFSNTPSNDKEAENIPNDDKATEDKVDASDDDFALDIVESESEEAFTDEPVVPPSEEFEDLVATEDDPFGIGALVEEEDLVVELDSEAEDSIQETSDEIDIDALIAGSEETIELSDDDLAASDDSNQADLDLAAEWESQLASESEDDAAVELSSDDDNSASDTDDKKTADELAELETLLDTEVPQEDDGSVIDEVIDSETDGVESEAEDPTDIDAILATSDDVESEVEDPTDIDAILAASDDVESEVADPTDIDAILDESDDSEVADPTDIGAILDESDDGESEVEDPTDIDAILDASDEGEVADPTDIDAILAASDDSESEVADPTDIDAILDESDDGKSEVEDPTDIDAILDASENSESDIADPTDIDAILDASDDDESEVEDLTDIDAIVDVSDDVDSDVEEVEAVLESEDTASVEEVIDLSEFEDIDISTLKNVDEAISALDEEEKAEDLDILTQQLSEGTFNEDAPLPSIDKNDDDGFIDIESLLEDTNSEEVIEDEFNLELGLEEFPDVVESFAEYDTDDTGIAAQLDLARAYLEIDEKNGAKEILTALLDTAKEDQLNEVKKLLNKID